MPFDNVPAETPYVKRKAKQRQRLYELRDLIAKLDPKRFDMSEWYCGTSGCIGGWATVMIWGAETHDGYDEYKVGRALGLTQKKTSDLFFMGSSDYLYADVNKEAAVAVLDHLIQTGKVDWDRVLNAKSR